MAQSKVVILLFATVIVCSEQTIFSSIIRNNLNRYLKNPLFTKSFVRTSIWPGEQDDHHGSTMGLISNANQINEFIKSQNKFTNDHILEPYANFNFDLMNQYAGSSIMSQAKVHPPLPSHQASIHPPPIPTAAAPVLPLSSPTRLIPKFSDVKSVVNLEESRDKKSLTVSSNTNAYSDAKKLESTLGKPNLYSFAKVNNTNAYIGDNIDNYLEPETRRIEVNRYKGSKSANRNFENNLQLGNKYNQEKALNLKLEYGFKPLPQRMIQPMVRDFQKDFTVSNSIQLNNDFEQENKRKSSEGREYFDDDLFDDDLDSFAPKVTINRTMKSMSKPTDLGGNNHLEDFAADYKKYISYPMETESSDVHKLAFTGMDSFKPEHTFVDLSSHRFEETISNYPNIENFKTEGLECSQERGFCEYDSSYPKDYVNSIITNCTSLIDSMYIEMPEDLADFKGYKSFIQVGQSNSRQQHNGSLCDSDRKYIRPSVIQDVKGSYYLILQSSYYFQQVPVEICNNPGSICNVVGHCHTGVRCTQKYRTHMLISIEETAESFKNRRGPNCPRMRMFRLPSACVCELRD